MKIFRPDGLVDCEDPECCENPVCERSQLCHTVSAPIGEHFKYYFNIILNILTMFKLMPNTPSVLFFDLSRNNENNQCLMCGWLVKRG